MEAEGSDSRCAWLLERLFERSTEMLDGLLHAMSDDLAIATGDAVSVRELSSDGRSLLPLVAHHPGPLLAESMFEAMRETVQPLDSGLWRSVTQTLRPRRWHLAVGEIPREASSPQQEFLHRFSVRAIMGAPILADGRLVGGVALVRFTTDLAFSDEDEDLLTTCAERFAPVLLCRSSVLALAPKG